MSREVNALSVDRGDRPRVEPDRPDSTLDDARLRTDVVDAPVDVEALVEWATTPQTGAVVTFMGTVRDHSVELSDVVAIDYEVFERAARVRLQELGRLALDTVTDLGRVAIIHRRGKVALGESSVWVVVSAAHRESAFDAAAYCLDLLKQTVPIWKRETTATGSSHSSAGTPATDLATAHREWWLRRGSRTL